jgi:hypothetical protein
MTGTGTVSCRPLPSERGAEMTPAPASICQSAAFDERGKSADNNELLKTRAAGIREADIVIKLSWHRYRPTTA